MTKKELAALAMRELIKREQSLMSSRTDEQLKISNMSDEALKKLVERQDL